MNRAQKDSAKIKKYELSYRAWLKRLFKEFGKFTLNRVVHAIENDTSLSPALVEYFYSKINFDPINKTFQKILEQNEKFFEKMIIDTIKPTKRTVIQKLMDETLPQRILFNSFTQEEISKKRLSFFELEKDIIKAEMINDYTKRKNQLDEFRQSYLFNSPDNSEKFKEKYPEPKYKFTDSMGRTQINNLNRDLSAVLATNMGAKECEWLTSGDERVRETHRELNGLVFKYTNLPVEYNDYNCRCTLLPILESIEGLF
jgi:SPP1 gp7 family putative phage head morphogenesis protein